MQRRVIRTLYRATRKYIIDHAYRDFVSAETVCVTSPKEVGYHLTVTYPQYFEDLSTIGISSTVEEFTGNFEKGEVLVDSRGRGTFQR